MCRKTQINLESCFPGTPMDLKYSNTSKSNKQARDSNGFERTTAHIIAGKTQRIRRTKSLTTSSLGIGHVFICMSGKTHDNNKKYIQA